MLNEDLAAQQWDFITYLERAYCQPCYPNCVGYTQPLFPPWRVSTSLHLPFQAMNPAPSTAPGLVKIVLSTQEAAVWGVLVVWAAFLQFK